MRGTSEESEMDNLEPCKKEYRKTKMSKYEKKRVLHLNEEKMVENRLR